MNEAERERQAAAGIPMIEEPYDRGCITRPHFHGYKSSDDDMAPPPLHVRSAHGAGNWVPLPPRRPDSGQPGPALVGGGAGPCLGIDPTDPSTWEGRGYGQSPGMIGRFNSVMPGAPFGEGLTWAP